MPSPSDSAVEWTTEQFDHADPGDQRHPQRLVHSTAAITTVAR